MSTNLAFLDRFEKGSCVTDVPLHLSPFATITRLVDGRNTGRPAAFLSDLLT